MGEGRRARARAEGEWCECRGVRAGRELRLRLRPLLGLGLGLRLGLGCASAASVSARAAAGYLERVDEAVPLPSDSEQPCRCRCDRGAPRPVCRRTRKAPALEARTRRASVERARRSFAATHGVVPLVEEHVREGIPRLPRRAKSDAVIAIGEHAAAPLERAIELLREADAEPLHAAPERFLTLGLDDEVQMVALHRPLDQPHAEPVPRCREGAPHDLHAALRPQTRHVPPEPQRDVDRRPPVEPGPRRVPDPSTDPPILPLAPRSPATPTPSGER